MFCFPKVKSPSQFTARIVLPWEQDAFEKALHQWQDQMQILADRAVINDEIHVVCSSWFEGLGRGGRVWTHLCSVFLFCLLWLCLNKLYRFFVFLFERRVTRVLIQISQLKRLRYKIYIFSLSSLLFEVFHRQHWWNITWESMGFPEQLDNFLNCLSFVFSKGCWPECSMRHQPCSNQILL